MNNQSAEHVLVVGGSGMLRGLCLALAGRGRTVTVIGRTPQRLSRLVKESNGLPGSIHALAVDYRDDDRLRRALETVTPKFGTITLAAVWVHSTAPQAPYSVAEFVQGRYFHVLGSAVADPSRPDDTRRAHFEAIPAIVYHEVILGFVPGPFGSRWLTDDEICAGVLQAIDADQPRFIVGTVEPWSARP